MSSAPPAPGGAWFLLGPLGTSSGFHTLKVRREAPAAASDERLIFGLRDVLGAVKLQGADLSRQYQLAKAVDVPARRINEIVHGQRRITADTALRLSRYFGTSERFWLNLQARYDLETEKDRLGAALDDIRPLSAAS